MTIPSFPARLHVLVPSKCSNAIIIRRGPSKHSCVMSWNLETDEVTQGQWLKGRIYERRSDVSPDGKHWIYFAMNGHWAAESRGSWTAVARSPFLKAVVFLPKGDCWHGGGLFTDDRTYWVNDGCGHQVLEDSKEVRRVDTFDGLRHYGGECPGVYYNRLQRDGWELADRIENGRHDVKVHFEKPLSQGWVFRKICHEQIGAPRGKGCYWDEHEMIAPGGEVLSFADWEWAERTGDEIVFAQGGCLWRTGVSGPDSLSDLSLVHDLNEYKFDNLEAPY